MSIRSLAIAVLAFLAAPLALAQTTVTLQQGLNGYTGTADNWIIWSSGANTNKGGLVELDLRSTTDYGLVRFAIFQSEGGPVPNGSTITSATLSLYKFWGPDAVFKASRVLKDWTELGSTWNSTGTGAAWSTPGAQGLGSDILSSADGQGSVPDAVANSCNDNIGHDVCWLNIDVTAGVSAFASGTANFGWLLQQVSSSGVDNYKNFNSKEETSFPRYRPKLTITYTPASPGQLSLVSGLAFSPASPAANEAVTATFTVQNSAGQAITFRNLVTAVRDPANTIVDFTATGTMTLQPGQQYAYSAMKSFTTSGTYTTWPAYFDGTNWVNLAPQSTLTVGPAKISLIAPLALSPASPAANQAVTATFTIQNMSTQAITLQNLVAAARDPANGFVDFTATGPLTLQPGQQYLYSATRSFATSGTYTTWPVFFDGVNWVNLAPQSTFTVGTAGISLITPLALSPASPAVNESTTATFTVQNTSSQAITVQNFGAAARDPANANVDFPAVGTTTLQPGQQFAYSAARSFATSGTYAAWPFYFNGVDWIELAPHSAFTVGGTPPTNPPVVSSFTLVNGDTNALIANYDPLASGATIDLANMPTRRLNIRANTSPASIGSVRFGFDANAAYSIDNTAPYELAGDPYPGWTPSVGSHTVSATPFSSAGASGLAGQTVSANFTVTDSSPPVDPNACVPSSNPNKTGATVATFHSMSIYYNRGSAPAGNLMYLRYRLAGADETNPASWKRGHDLWYDGRGVYPAFNVRGSVVHLQPGTKYVFEVGTGATYESANWEASIVNGTDACPSTWSENFPVGAAGPTWSGPNSRTTSSLYKGQKGAEGLSRNHVLLADQSGSDSGYTLYDFSGKGAEAIASNTDNTFPVVISGHHIILKGLKVTGGEDGIWIDPGSHHIVIEECDISGYGRQDPSGEALGAGLSGSLGRDEDAGIKFPEGRFGPFRDTVAVVIQHNRIHNPAFGAHPWDTSTPHRNGAHPYGPSPITMYPTGGQVVIRYNTVYSTTGDQLPDGPPDLNHFHQDGLVLGGCNEDTADGGETCFNMHARGLGPDVDIYKNLVMHYWDDGTETDGDGINTRVWGNYFDYGGASAVSSAPTYVGPTYIWRNVYNRARMWASENWGNEHERLYTFKSSGLSGYNGGRRYIYHNTSLQPPFSSEPVATGPKSLGGGYGSGGNSGSAVMENTVARNNVFENWFINVPSAESAYNEIGTTNDLDYDLSNGPLGASEPHGIANRAPQYQPGNGGTTTPHSGKYRLAPGTSGHNDGVPIPNFNDNAIDGPDRGAHEDGTPDMDFGTSASGS